MNSTLSPAYQPTGAATALLRAVSAELLKTRRTLALWMVFIAPLSIAFLQFVLYMQRDAYIREAANAWWLINRQMLTYWSLLMLPLYVTLETALIANLDHANDHWKRLFTLPLPRWTIYAAKQLVNLLLVGVSFFVLLALSLGMGLFLRALKPGIGLEQPIPFMDMGWLTLITFVCSWLVIALHTWVSLYWRSFVVAMGVGIVMTVGGMLAINTDAGGYYPWVLTAVMVNAIDNGEPYRHLLALGGLSGLILPWIGCWLFTRRDVL